MPSAAVGPFEWDHDHAALVESLRDLIRLRTVNPPGDEILAARYLEGALVDAGLRPEVVEPFPGRGSISVRLRGDGTGGEPLLLLSHIDVVPAPADDWTHDPFGADVADGYVWGRGAVDMKGMVAMELAVVRRLAGEARAAGRDPASDPIPGLRRDVLFTATADEEAGGFQGAGWVVELAPSGFAQPARSTSVAASRSSSAAVASTPSRSPRRASPCTASPSVAHGATARCRDRTTPRSGPPRSCPSWRDPSRRA